MTAGAMLFGGKMNGLVIQVERDAQHFYVPCIEQTGTNKNSELFDLARTMAPNAPMLHPRIEVYERVAADVFVLVHENYDFDPSRWPK